jgi:hypothetical protein
MLNRLASLPHFLRVLIKPALHRFQNVFVLPAGDASPYARFSAPGTTASSRASALIDPQSGAVI